MVRTHTNLFFDGTRTQRMLALITIPLCASLPT